MLNELFVISSCPLCGRSPYRPYEDYWCPLCGVPSTDTLLQKIYDLEGRVEILEELLENQDEEEEEDNG